MGLALGGLYFVSEFALSETRGVGSFDLRVRLTSGKPIAAVWYEDATIRDPEYREYFLTNPDPQLIESRNKVLQSDQFVARVMCTDRSTLFRYEVTHRSHLLIVIEFNDGSKTSRIIDIPPGTKHDEIVVDLG